MVSIFVRRNGQTEQAASIDRSWLNPASGAIVWVDLARPSALEALVLSDTFQFHRLAVEDAMSELAGVSGVITAMMLMYFRRKRWM